MTGRQLRVLSGYHELSSSGHPAPPTPSDAEHDNVHFNIPELLHNINLLIDESQQVRALFTSAAFLHIHYHVLIAVLNNSA